MEWVSQVTVTSPSLHSPNFLKSQASTTFPPAQAGQSTPALRFLRYAVPSELTRSLTYGIEPFFAIKLSNIKNLTSQTPVSGLTKRKRRRRVPMCVNTILPALYSEMGK